MRTGRNGRVGTIYGLESKGRALVLELVNGHLASPPRFVPELPQQIRRDLTTILGGGSEVVDWRDLALQDLLRLRDRRSSAERCSVCESRSGGRRHAAHRQPELPCPTRRRQQLSRSPAPRACRLCGTTAGPRRRGISNADDQLVGPRDGLAIAGVERRRTGRAVCRRRCAARPPRRRRPAPAGCRRPATRSRRCRRACRGSGSARRRPRAPRPRASAAASVTAATA